MNLLPDPSTISHLIAVVVGACISYGAVILTRWADR